MTTAVANYDERRETEVLAAFHHFGDGDGDNVVLEVGR